MAIVGAGAGVGPGALARDIAGGEVIAAAGVAVGVVFKALVAGAAKVGAGDGD